MATRITTGERRRQMTGSLRAAVQDGTMPVGTILPTVRELADKYGLSVFAVSKELQALVEEGVLYTLPRIGTFVGQSMAHMARCFLLVTSDVAFVPFLALGFEERIAQLGASSLVLRLDEALDRLAAGRLPELSGVFDFASNERSPRRWPVGISRSLVRFADQEGIDPADPDGRADRVYFDEIGGGRQAVWHLLRMGHKRIAYLGLHARTESAYYHWSAKRMQGWREAMEQYRCYAPELALLPDVEPGTEETEPATAAELAKRLCRRDDITAVVCANDNAVLGLIDAFVDLELPASRWPAILGFDDDPVARKHVLTSIRLPWEEVGRTAAQLLWDRANSEESEAPKFASIPMRVIARPQSAHPRTAAVRKHAAQAPRVAQPVR